NERNRRLAVILAIAGLILSTSTAVFAQSKKVNPITGETPEQFDKRTKWWRDARFGMFIHWGLYAVPADPMNVKGERSLAEWYLSNKQMQVADYEKFTQQFNPVKFDAKKWVKTARDAGMKYIVI